jgi:hypothetical protein
LDFFVVELNVEQILEVSDVRIVHQGPDRLKRHSADGILKVELKLFQFCKTVFIFDEK